MATLLRRTNDDIRCGSAVKNGLFENVVFRQILFRTFEAHPSAGFDCVAREAHRMSSF